MDVVMQNINQPSNTIQNIKYVMTHLGLGDNFICHGIIREYAKQNKVITFAKPQYYQTVSFMYRDDNNITVLPYDDQQAIQFLSQQQISHDNFIGIGIYGQNWNTSITDKSFDQIFYEQANVSFEKRCENFHIVRDLNNELELFKQFGVKEKEYIFIHDDPSRNYNIYKHIPEGVQVVRNTLGNNIIDYAYLIENALEVHVIESSFKLMIDFWGSLNQDKLYFHTYGRGIPECDFLQSKRVKNWTIID
jgi:hypothetical protein